MFEKSSAKSVKTNPLFAELVARTGEAPQSNFHKYFVDRECRSVSSFATRVEADRRERVTAREKLLAEQPAAPDG